MGARKTKVVKVPLLDVLKHLEFYSKTGDPIPPGLVGDKAVPSNGHFQLKTLARYGIDPLRVKAIRFPVLSYASGESFGQPLEADVEIWDDEDWVETMKPFSNNPRFLVKPETLGKDEQWL